MLRKILSIAIIAGIISFFYSNHTLDLPEFYFSDKVLRQSNEVDSRVKMLVVDDKSLEEVGKWPWPRKTIAETIEKLVEGGAKAVFLDIMYSEHGQNPEDDNALQEVVKKYDNVFLASNFVFEGKKTIENGTERLAIQAYNDPIFEIDKNQLGHINTLPDADGTVRKVLLGVQNDNEIVPAISVRLANQLLSEEGMEISWDEKGQWFRGNELLPTNNLNQVNFTFSTAPQDSAQKDIGITFDTQPIYQLIKEDFAPEYFADSIVLIGPYSVGLQDQYYTPMSKNTAMFGVEIHANIIQSLLDDSLYTNVSTPVGTGIIVLMTALAFFVIDRFNAKWGFFTFIGFFAIYYIAFLVIFNTQSLVLPFIYVLLALTVVYITSVVSQYILERKEKSRVTNLFGRYVSKGVVDEILSTTEEVKLGGVRKEVTLLFVDIRGFTPLSEKMEPEEVIVILNEYLDLCTRAVFEYEGTLDKFMGDGVMSFFGAPIEQEDHAERAVRAALRMKENSGEMEKRLLEKYGRTVSFGIGINSGPAVIGNIGSHDRLDYTAIGDTVNLSARLESNAKPGQILISENTYNLVKDKFNFTALEPIKVKGKEHPVTIYQVEGEK